MLDGAVDTDRMTSSSIHGKGEGAVGQGVRDGPVRDAESVHHFFPNLHATPAFPWATFQHFNAQPLTHGIGFHHSRNNWMNPFSHLDKVRVICT